MGVLCNLAAATAAFIHIVIADIAFGPWGWFLSFWPVILIGLIVIAVVLLVRIMNKRKKK